MKPVTGNFTGYQLTDKPFYNLKSVCRLWMRSISE